MTDQHTNNWNVGTKIFWRSSHFQLKFYELKEYQPKMCKCTSLYGIVFYYVRCLGAHATEVFLFPMDVITCYEHKTPTQWSPYTVIFNYVPGWTQLHRSNKQIRKSYCLTCEGLRMCVLPLMSSGNSSFLKGATSKQILLHVSCICIDLYSSVKKLSYNWRYPN